VSPGSVTIWLGQLRVGDPDAARLIWNRYFSQVARLARARLRGSPLQVSDEEDVAAAAFDSFYRAVRQDTFPQLADRDDLWQVLVTLTIRKAIDQRRRWAAVRRGGGESPVGLEEELADQLASREPDPQLAAQVADQFAHLLGALADDELQLRRIALLKLEGHENEAIAASCGCGLRTVERRVCLIRKTWEELSSEALPERSPT
jgi:DNA-directed RNA polymerase specialized sigma24 family protein